MAVHMMQAIFSMINLACGIMLVVTSFYNDFCSWFRIFFGVAIAWVSITSAICDQHVLQWFPLWNRSFGFMGTSYIFLACRGYTWVINDGSSWNGFFYFFIWAVGIAYCVIWALMLCKVTGCPHPKPLLEACQEANSGGGSSGTSKPRPAPKAKSKPLETAGP